MGQKMKAAIMLFAMEVNPVLQMSTDLHVEIVTINARLLVFTAQ